MKDNKLEVGDVLYGWGRGSFGSIFKTKVARLTPKRAVLDNGTQVVNELTKDTWRSTLVARIVGEYGDMRLENDELKAEYNNAVLMAKAHRVYNSIKVRELTPQQCQALIDLFPEPTK